MCDYSLMMVPNRLAIEGEELVAHKFGSGSTGIVSCRDFEQWTTRQPKSFWQWLKDGLSLGTEPAPAVCIPPGARLRLIGIPEELKTQFSGDLSPDVVFTQISAEVNERRDALFFANGATVLLQRLPEGQRLKVLWLSSLEDFMPDPGRAERVPAA
jgi:hypothetical protein